MFLTLIPKYVLLKIPKHKTHEIDYQTKLVKEDEACMYIEQI